MAVIGKIRKRSGLLIAIIGIALAAFVLGDLFKNRGARKNIPIAVVNGEKISFADFNKLSEENVENQKAQSQTGNVSDVQRYYIKKQTYDQMVKDVLMEEIYGKLGIDVKKEELYDLVQGKNPHPIIKQYFTNPETNIFDAEMVRQFIGNLDQMDARRKDLWLSLEDYIKNDRKLNEFNNLILKAHYVPNALAKMEYVDQGKTANIDFFGVKYQTVKDDQISVTENDYKDYYNKNKYRFQNENAQVNLDYVVFNIKPSKEDMQAVTRQMNDLSKEIDGLKMNEIPQFINAVSDVPYNKTWKGKGQLSPRIEETMLNSKVGTKVGPYIQNNTYYLAKLMETTMRPDSMKASHILIAYKGAARADEKVTRDKESAKKLADSLLAIAKKSPRKFDKLAEKYSNGPSASKGGDLGWFADGAMVPAFNEAVIDNKKNAITSAETQFGYHIIKVTGKKKPVKKVKVAEIVREILPSSKTIQDMYVKASRFSGENNTAEKFKKAIADENLSKRTTGLFDISKYNISGIENPRQIVRWAFDEERKVGDVSNVFEDDEKYIVAVVTEKEAPGYLPLEEVKSQIEPLVKREKKAEVLLKKFNNTTGNFNAKAKQLGAEIKHYDNLTYTTSNIKDFGAEKEAIGEIFQLKNGETSTPIQGNMAVYLVKMNKVQLPKEIKNYDGVKKRMDRDFSRLTNNIYNSIKESADIEDNSILAF